MSWKSGRQSLTATSTSEAELLGAANADEALSSSVRNNRKLQYAGQTMRSCLVRQPVSNCSNACRFQFKFEDQACFN
eukprot:1125733-Amphidinium_carterae.2